MKIATCSWCGHSINGEVIAPGGGGYETWGVNPPQLIEYEVGFCCDGCAWRFWSEEEGLFGLTGAALREHLIKEHGLKHPPGPPAGKQGKECFDFIRKQVKTIHELFPQRIF